MKRLKRVSFAIITTFLLFLAVPILLPAFSDVIMVHAATGQINKEKLSLYVGNTYKLKISGTTRTVTWSSGNKSVASVSSTGKVTAKKKGTATITAAVNGKKYTCKVTVITKYKDGVYEGSGIGFRNGTTTVSVTVKNDVITKVEVVSYRDTPDFFEYASPTIIDEIMSSQSTDVDTVSGATFSSRGMINAVQNALNKAKN